CRPTFGPAYGLGRPLASRKIMAAARRSGDLHVLASSPAVWSDAGRDLVDVAIHAAFDSECLAGRGSRVVGPQSGIDPGEVVEDADGTDGFVDDVAAAARGDRLRERAHRAGLALRVLAAGVDTALEPGTRRTVRHRQVRVPPVVDVGVGRRLE